MMRYILTIGSLLFASALFAQAGKRVVVDQKGKGNYRSIQAAINSLPDSSATPTTIFIRNGVYKEKLYIEKNNVILQGESREGTIITASIARDEWRCNHHDDWGVATMNVDGDDITLKDLTVTNAFGYELKTDYAIPCPTDTVTHQKKITKTGHQMALRTMSGNRLRAINCHFKAFGGDTVSPWDVRSGMFYFRDCIMEGGVDFYCPRGWAWAENCQFITRSGTAAVWHDGSANPDSKTVFKNCRFDGFKGFNLARYHRDAQFYFIGCNFSENMADKDVYLVPTTNMIQWGRRVYFFNCHKAGGDYSWFSDNLTAAAAAEVTPNWLFHQWWKPNATIATVPKLQASLRKKTNNGYSSTLVKEDMPFAHKPNDFTTTPLPYYQNEGPSWENDKVGFRLYLDTRNAKDIFGKTTSSMVLDTVGRNGDKFYHQFDSSWGMDILKVGKSLGAGSLALSIPVAGQKDTLVRLGGASIGSTRYELLKETPDELIIRMHYNNWKVLDRIYQLHEDISIRPGTWYYESRVNIDGLKGDEKLVSGIVNLKSSNSYQLLSNGRSILYTHDKQSENNDLLGMAIMVNADLQPQFSEAPKESSDIMNTYLVAFPAKTNKPLVFRFYAGWERSNPAFGSKESFEKFLMEEAKKWLTEKTIKKTL